MVVHVHFGSFSLVVSKKATVRVRARQSSVGARRQCGSWLLRAAVGLGAHLGSSASGGAFIPLSTFDGNVYCGFIRGFLRG
jgi:hypothetical protein